MISLFRKKPDPMDAAIAARKAAWRAEELQAATGKGRWVLDADMHPMTNVCDRLYRTADGSVHRAIFFPLFDKPQAWFFPD